MKPQEIFITLEHSSPLWAYYYILLLWSKIITPMLFPYLTDDVGLKSKYDFEIQYKIPG